MWRCTRSCRILGRLAVSRDCVAIRTDLPGQQRCRAASGVKSQPALLAISKHINATEQAAYDEWHSRLEEKLKQHPGFLAIDMQDVAHSGLDKTGLHMLIMAFESKESKEAWLTCDARQQLLKEGEKFQDIIGNSSFHFDEALWGMADLPKNTSATPPKWKTALMILSAMYPTLSFNTLAIHAIHKTAASSTCSS